MDYHKDYLLASLRQRTSLYSFQVQYYKGKEKWDEEETRPCFAFLQYDSRYFTALPSQQDVDTLVVTLKDNLSAGTTKIPHGFYAKCLAKDMKQYGFKFKHKQEGSKIILTFNLNTTSSFEIKLVGSIFRMLHESPDAGIDYFLLRHHHPDLDPFVCVLLCHFGIYTGCYWGGHCFYYGCLAQYINFKSGHDFVIWLRENCKLPWKEDQRYTVCNNSISGMQTLFLTSGQRPEFNKARLGYPDKNIVIESFLSKEGYEKHPEVFKLAKVKEKLVW
jgi:hypothetical protein